MQADAISKEQITAVVLAGGRGRRLGGRDKGLIELGGKALAAHVAARLRPQCHHLLISANRHLDAYRRLGPEVVPDSSPDHPGPMAGIAAAMAVAPSPYLLTTPCDAPFVPTDLARRMAATMAREKRTSCICHDGQRPQILFALLPVTLRHELETQIARGHLKVSRWIEEQNPAVLHLPDRWAFFNINRPEDLTLAEAHLATIS